MVQRTCMTLSARPVWLLPVLELDERCGKKVRAAPVTSNLINRLSSTAVTNRNQNYNKQTLTTIVQFGRQTCSQGAWLANRLLGCVLFYKCNLLQLDTAFSSCTNIRSSEDVRRCLCTDQIKVNRPRRHALAVRSIVSPMQAQCMCS